MNTIPITKVGAELLKAELHRLKHVERPAVINAISEARAQGDLSENAEYDAAKEKQGFIEGRIKELETTLSALKLLIRQPWRLRAVWYWRYRGSRGFRRRHEIHLPNCWRR
jgi:hypothetical protein